MNRLALRLDQFWFPAVRPAWLALLRVLVGGYALYYLSTRYDMMVSMAGSGLSLFEPVGLARLLDQPISPVLFELILGITIVFNVAFILGWGFRLSGPVFAGLLLWVLCYRNSWLMLYHANNLLVLHALILGFAPAADALSVDALVRKWLAKCRGEVPGGALASWRYGWPVQLMQTVTVLTYFLAGVAKVCGPAGWAWATGQSLQSHVALDGMRKELFGSVASELTWIVYDQTWLFLAMGVGALALELGAPLFLLGRRTSRVWAVAALLFHWGVFFVMGIKFRYQLCGFAFASFFVMHREVSLANESSTAPLLSESTSDARPASAKLTALGA